MHRFGIEKEKFDLTMEENKNLNKDINNLRSDYNKIRNEKEEL